MIRRLKAWIFDPKPNLITKGAAEFTGSMLFHFIGTSLPTPAVNAVALMGFVYYSAKLSGGHLNPALTGTFALLGYTNPIEVLVYWASQISGALVGSLLVASLSTDLEIGRRPVTPSEMAQSGCFYPNPTLSSTQVLGWEAICTFSFILPIFSVVWYTQQKSGYGNTGPIMVGLSLFAAASAASTWTGGALNPARALASYIVFDCGPETKIGYYIAGEFIGACVVPIAIIPWYGVAAEVDTPATPVEEIEDEKTTKLQYHCRPTRISTERRRRGSTQGIGGGEARTSGNGVSIPA